MRSAGSPNMKNVTAILFFLIIIVATAIFRILPHPSNFTPVLAVSLFAGALISVRKWQAFLIPVAAMVLSDLFLGWHSTLPAVYLAMVIAVLIGMAVGKSAKAHRSLLVGSVVMGGLASSVVFFVITNFAVWAFTGLYPMTLSGLWMSYVMGLPFFHNTVLSTLIFSGVFFAIYQLLDPRFKLAMAWSRR